jgi:hypothetical protein
MFATQNSTFPSDIPEKFLDKNRFKEYFKEMPTPGLDRWSVAFNKLDESGLRQLQEAFDILIEEIKFIFHAIEVEDDRAFNTLKNLQQISFRMKGASLEYEDKKSLFGFLWSICSGFSIITGYTEPDYIEKIIKSL